MQTVVATLDMCSRARASRPRVRLLDRMSASHADAFDPVVADERHCVNSISLNFKGDDGKTLEG